MKHSPVHSQTHKNQGRTPGTDSFRGHFEARAHPTPTRAVSLRRNGNDVELQFIGFLCTCSTLRVPPRQPDHAHMCQFLLFFLD